LTALLKYFNGALINWGSSPTDEAFLKIIFVVCFKSYFSNSSKCKFRSCSAGATATQVMNKKDKEQEANNETRIDS